MDIRDAWHWTLSLKEAPDLLHSEAYVLTYLRSVSDQDGHFERPALSVAVRTHLEREFARDVVESLAVRGLVRFDTPWPEQDDAPLRLTLTPSTQMS